MKRFLSISVLLQAVTGLMTLTLVSLFAIYALKALDSQERARLVPTIVDISTDLFAAIQNFRLERGNTLTSLATPGVVSPEMQSEIAAFRTRSETALNSAFARLATVRLNVAKLSIDEIREKRDAFAKLRGPADAALTQPQSQRPTDLSAQWIDAHTQLASAIDRLSMQLESTLSQGDSFIANMVELKQIAWTVREDTGRDRFRIAQALVSGRQFSDEEKRQFAILAGRVDGAWKLIQDEANLDATPPDLKQAVEEANRLYFVELRRTRNAVIQDLSAGRQPSISAREWVRVATPGQQAIFTVGNVALRIADHRALEQLNLAERHFYAAILLMALFSAIGVLTSWYVFKQVVNPITKITDTMRLVANGKLDCHIPFEQRHDEIGSLAQGLRVFRDNAIEKQKLRVEKDGAETASRAKSEFLANMSHELRTPLNAIIGFSEVIKNTMFGPASERYPAYAADIFKSGTHLLALINEILDLSKLEAGQLELHEEIIDLAATVEACISLVVTQAQQSKVRLSTSIGKNVPFIRADDRRLRQVLINLLSNALKFTPENGQVCLSIFQKDGDLRIAIRDTGIGIAPEDIPKAMTTFGQVDSTISRKHEGTGLGLPLAKHLVELHGGTLTIDSEVNVGTTVTVILGPERIVEAMPQMAAARSIA